MKYVKIYDSKGQCQGVADIEQNYDKAGYAKLLDSNMHVIGFVDVDNITESGENMPFVQVFDENMLPCGVVTADNIRHSDGYLITLQKDPSTTGAVTGGGRFIAGTSVTVVATPDAQSQYPEFGGWYDAASDTKVSENASYTFTVSGARTLVARFKEATIDIKSIDPSLPWAYPTATSHVKMNGIVTIADVLAHLKVELTNTGTATLSYNSATYKIEVLGGTIQLPHYEIQVYGDELTFEHTDPDALYISSLTWN